MATIQRAIEIAAEAHKNQKDKSGNPYILHVLSVMNKGKTETEKICGVLHDLLEDTDWTPEMLKQEGFSDEIIDIIICLSKVSDDENYDDFIARIKLNKKAIRVKLNDLQDNMDITRISVITEKDIPRLNKYLKAYRELMELID